MTKLNTITIDNIKGIQSRKIELDLNPNKPCILVAPNGFGKSSIACGFNSLNRNRIDLSDSEHYKKDTSNKPQITIRHDGTDYHATDSSNYIYNVFDISVINAQVVAKATKRNMGRYTTATASLEVSNVVLVDNIPANAKFPYKCTTVRGVFGVNGKVLENAEAILDDLRLWGLIDEHQFDFSVFGKARSYKNLIAPVVNEINGFSGTANQVKSQIAAIALPKFKLIAPLSQLADLIKPYLGADETESVLLAWQIASISQLSGFKEAVDYRLYLREKEFFDSLLSSADSTIHGIKTSEEKASGGKRQLVVKFPSADYMSNGQRDILSFISQIHRSMRKLRKEHCILIIDEIFDYMDDANLVAFQFYVTQLIDMFKEQGRKIYPLLLTHLDPSFFRHFCFNKNKLQIRYLNRDTSVPSSVFLKLVRNRGDTSIKSGADLHHFHYNPSEIDLEPAFLSLGMQKAWGKSHSFYKVVHDQVNEYLDGKPFDPIAVLFSVRIKIEEKVYAELSDPGHQGAFISTHGTANKLDYAESLGINIPEIYYLLGIIYNDSLHWRDGRDYDTPLRSKLDNFVIRNMIAEVYR